MQVSSVPEIPNNPQAKSSGPTGGSLFPVPPLLLALICVIALAVYWSSSFVLDLEIRDGKTHFGADTLDFEPLAEGQISNRNLRVHPLTIGLSQAWMMLMKPLTGWFELEYLHRLLFALIGAMGVWAAMCAFSSLLERKYVALCGIIYASTLGIWYFASIEESKIVSATLCSLYIAVYLCRRHDWTKRDTFVLTAILLAACLNEIVAGFLVVIPALDALLRYGWNIRKLQWIALHALIVPAALTFLELVVNGVIAAPTDNPENASHFKMFFFYLTREYNLAAFYIYVINWFFFSLAAPAPEAKYLFDRWPMHPYYFEPELSNYFQFPAQAAIAVVFFVIVAGAMWALLRKKLATDTLICLSALLAYALLRCVFFYFIHPLEGLLFSSSIVLAHLLLLIVPLAASPLPGKRLILALFAILLFIGNGMFIAGKAL